MREEFRSELSMISRTLVTMSQVTRDQMRRATSALLEADQTDAEQVLAADAEVDAYYRIIEDRVYDTMARQAPVASDLRLVITTLHMAADLERMGKLAAHIARSALRRHPGSAVAEPLHGIFKEMGVVADTLATKITKAMSERDIVAAGQLDRDDDAMDDLHSRLFGVMFQKEWPAGVEAAVDAALLGRYFERYADHAVNVGKHVVFLVTGENLDRE
ncbi:phosphate signaling complex protein PhoU [Virgisporangium aliadipatigenens]|nr:phosphate signaling complex protein PhoU [Virgisporangium aliadipatigenens]